ncbi:MAG TPA: tetratricopeptide repeat protein, partial [Kofleriaceae bacterium]|nr:tetratricopeptide repeat protein [Kofleriaceae bacterium]
APPATAKPPALPANVGELGVPARIQRVVVRALAWERDQRYPSMTALLGELRQDPDARRRTMFASVGLAVLAVAAVAGVYTLRGSRGRELCTGAAKRLAGAWDGPIEHQTEAAFTATHKPFAAPAFAGVKRHLDRYTREWTAAVTESCEATRVRGEQTEEVLTLREACLDHHLDEVRALTGLLVQADAAMVEKGDKLVLDLDPIAECANVTALRAPGLPPPALRVQIAELEKQLAAAKADTLAGHYLAALTKAQGVIERVKPLNYPPTLAEALVVHGAALLTVGNFTDASADFRDAVWDAIRGKRDDLAARAGLSMALVTSSAGGKPGEAKIWLGHAQALASRLGVDRTLELRMLEIESLIEAESGDNTAAIATGEKTLAFGESLYGKDAPQLIPDEINVADAYSHAGSYGKAAPHYERAKALRVTSVGADHPDIALIESDLGACYNHMGEAAKARAAFEQSLAIREKFYGKTSPLLVATLDNFGELLRKQGDVATALAYQERALPLCRMVPGVAHPFYHQLVTDYADTLIAAKRFADAHARLDELFVLEQANQSPTLPASQTTRAELALAEGKWSDAETYAALAIAGYETAGGKDNPTLWRPLTALARAKVGEGKAADAKSLVTRALAIGKQAQISDDDLAPTKALVAQLGD